MRAKAPNCSPSVQVAIRNRSLSVGRWRVVGEVSHGDHTVFVGETLEAGVRAEDQAILMRDHNLN